MKAIGTKEVTALAATAGAFYAMGVIGGTPVSYLKKHGLIGGIVRRLWCVTAYIVSPNKA